MNVMNNSNSSNEPYPFLGLKLEITLPVICVSTILFLAAILLVIAFKLHRFLVYRLALYQVISAKICFVFMVLILYQTLPPKLEYSFALSSILLKVVLTVWIVFHLFVLSVFYKNWKMLESLYVVSSVVVAVVIFILAMSLYESEFGRNNFYLSYYNDSNDGLFKFETSIFYLGLFLIVVSSVLVMIMAVTLCCRAFKTKNGVVSEYRKQHKKVLYEMLPLLVYIIFYLVVMFPMLSMLMLLNRNLYETIPNSNTLRIAITFFVEYFSASFIGAEAAISLWSIGCSSTLIIHILIVQCNKKRRKNLNYHSNNNNGENVTFGETTRILNTRSETYFSLTTED